MHIGRVRYIRVQVRVSQSVVKPVYLYHENLLNSRKTTAHSYTGIWYSLSLALFIEKASNQRDFTTV